MRLLCLLGCVAWVACHGLDAEESRGNLDKADLFGACEPSTCGEQSASGNCYCDDVCFELGDCFEVFGASRGTLGADQRGCIQHRLHQATDVLRRPAVDEVGILCQPCAAMRLSGEATDDHYLYTTIDENLDDAAEVSGHVPWPQPRAELLARAGLA